MSRNSLSLTKIVNCRYLTIIFFFGWFLFFLAISFFRDSRLDENIYLADSVQISNLLQNGEWIGNYGVGLHGFLNKLLLGIIFIFTGPSVFIATLTNIILGITSGILFYTILFKHFKFSLIFSLIAVTLLFCSYQFLSYIPTFYRDIGSLFIVLLVVESILSKKSKWITGLFLMLLLDTKEHVFYTIALAIIIWIGIESYINYKEQWYSWILEFIASGLKLFLPSLLFLVLMFTTSIIPLNIYNANILGLIEGGVEQVISNFDLEAATYNRDIAVNKEIARVMPTIFIPEGTSFIISSVLSFFNIVLSYVGKILYPRTFSFLSVPFVILIPSLVSAYQYFKKCIKIRKTNLLILPLSLFVFIAVYIFHASISRYIIPISPVIFLFYLLFLKNLTSKKTSYRKTLILTFLFMLAGLYFEYSYVLIKMVLNLVLFFVMFLIATKNNWNKEVLKYALVLILSMSFAGTSLLASYRYGQIKGFNLYGYNRECEKIVSLVDEKETVWINDIFWDKLPFVLRGENIGDPEWRWNLKEWVPKNELLMKTSDFKTYNFYWYKEEDFFTKINESRISKVIYIKLHKTNEKENLLLQDRLDELQSYNWLSLESSTEMKNKTVYVFDVKLVK